MGARGELTSASSPASDTAGTPSLVGFTTYDGTVTRRLGLGRAGRAQAGPPGAAGSYEALFHEVGEPRFLLRLARRRGGSRRLRTPRLERAIGVIYRPETERQSHYFEARLADQFDAVIHFDETRAVEPLERTAGWERGEPPETYPSGL